MSRISEVFDGNKKAFIPFVTAGDPNMDDSEKIILAIAAAGADIIELGIPFSDPVAEGAVIQEANIRALKNGATVQKIFALIERLRQKIDTPLVFLTYLNPVFHYGYDAFFAKCAQVGVNGIIIPDLPFEERDEVHEFSHKHKIDLISLIAPTSDERIKKIASGAEGYLYIVSSLGVTGVREKITTDIRAIVQKIREVTGCPCAVGFGISTPEQAREMAAQSDGAIVGSALVRVIADAAAHGENVSEKTADFVQRFADAVRSATKNF
ncbi:MAG: tryptophan synthase subunit alpha [Treponemataceae bacterium]|nr:MAG: tryptophan synthase subunit alpha [Treponemataceae bacterium]